MSGGKSGISVHGDVLVNLTADGVELNDVWAEVQEVLELWNTQRKSVADLLRFRTVNVADAVPQSITSDSFEEATELGVPRAIRPPSDVLKLGYSFKDYDISLSCKLAIRQGCNFRANPGAGNPLPRGR